MYIKTTDDMFLIFFILHQIIDKKLNHNFLTPHLRVWELNDLSRHFFVQKTYVWYSITLKWILVWHGSNISTQILPQQHITILMSASNEKITYFPYETVIFEFKYRISINLQLVFETRTTPMRTVMVVSCDFRFLKNRSCILIFWEPVVVTSAILDLT